MYPEDKNVSLNFLAAPSLPGLYLSPWSVSVYLSQQIPTRLTDRSFMEKLANSCAGVDI